MTENEAREGAGGTTEYQVGDTSVVVYPMTEGAEHELNAKHLLNLLAAEGE